MILLLVLYPAGDEPLNEKLLSGPSGASQPLQAASSSTSSSDSLCPLQSLQTPQKFSFQVPWSSLPVLTMGKLTQANERKEMADPDDLEEVKLAICKKLVSAYLAFRERNKGSPKHPGRKVYADITNQVLTVKIPLRFVAS